MRLDTRGHYAPPANGTRVCLRSNPTKVGAVAALPAGHATDNGIAVLWDAGGTTVESPRHLAPEGHPEQ